MIMLLLFLLPLLGSLSYGSGDVFVPVGEPYAQLGDTLDLTKLVYKAKVVSNIQSLTVEVDTYRDGIVIAENPSHVASLFGFRQPVPAVILLSETNSKWSFTGPFFKKAAELRDDTILIVSYAEKVHHKKTLPKGAEPIIDWENNGRYRGATHYVKEIAYGSQIGFYIALKAKRKEDYEDMKKATRDVLQKYSSKDPMYILNKIEKDRALRGKFTVPEYNLIVKGVTQGTPVRNSKAAMRYFSRFRKSKQTQHKPLKSLVRPLKDFNPRKQEFIMKFAPESLAPILDNVQAMYVETKSLKEKIPKIKETEANSKELNQLYSDVAGVKGDVQSALSKLSFQHGPEQFLPAIQKYGHPLGYYTTRYEQIRDMKLAIENSSADSCESKHKSPHIDKDEATSKEKPSLEGACDKGGAGLMTAPRKGVYKISYKVKVDGDAEAGIKILQGDTIKVDKMRGDGVARGVFFAILEKGDIIKVELVEDCLLFDL